DVRHRLDLVVEHDREVLRAALDVLLAARALACQRAALRLLARDVVEDLLALARELHQHDGLARLRIDVGARAGKLQVGAGHLRDAVVALRIWQAVRGQKKGFLSGGPLPAPAVYA